MKLFLYASSRNQVRNGLQQKGQINVGKGPQHFDARILVPKVQEPKAQEEDDNSFIGQLKFRVLDLKNFENLQSNKQCQGKPAQNGLVGRH